MTNSNDDRIIKKGSRFFSKKYIAKKKSKEESKTRSIIFRVLLVIAFLAGVFYNLYSHPYMKIQDIYISGNTITDDTEIIKKLRSPIGKNILLYKPTEYEKDLTSISYIKKVKIRKVFPKILSVKVYEEYPLFVKNSNIYITNTGKITKDVDPKIKDRLIDIKILNSRKNQGEDITSSKALMDFINTISQASFIADISQLNLENKLDIGIMVQDIEVKFGDLNNVDKKIKLLETIILDINKKGLEVESINLNNGENPLVVVDEESYNENLNK